MVAAGVPSLLSELRRLRPSPFGFFENAKAARSACGRGTKRGGASPSGTRAHLRIGGSRRRFHRSFLEVMLCPFHSKWYSPDLLGRVGHAAFARELHPALSTIRWYRRLSQRLAIAADTTLAAFLFLRRSLNSFQ